MTPHGSCPGSLAKKKGYQKSEYEIKCFWFGGGSVGSQDVKELIKSFIKLQPRQTVTMTIQQNPRLFHDNGFRVCWRISTT